MDNILLLGKYGQLGWELHRSLAPLGDIVAIDYPEINLLVRRRHRRRTFSAAHHRLPVTPPATRPPADLVAQKNKTPIES